MAFNAFAEKYGTSTFFSFQCLQGLNPLIFSQLCAIITQMLARPQELRLDTITEEESNQSTDQSIKETKIFLASRMAF